MSYFSIMFMMMYLSSFLLILSNDSWFLLWVGLEINMLSFIMLVYEKSIINIEMCLKYFFIQGVGSALLLMVLIMKSIFYKEAVVMILSYKMGAGPFYFWFSIFCEGVSWNSCFLIMSIQKLVPLMILSLFICSMVWLVMLMSMVIGLFGCFNETKLKKFLAFSSIHYIGWMMLCMCVNSYLWVLYLIGYMFMLLGVLMSIKKKEIFMVSDFLNFKNPFLFLYSMLNMGGMPPMLGFFLKWWVFLKVLSFHIWLVWLVITLAVIMFYVYMRMVYHIVVGYNFSYLYMSQDMYLFSMSSKEWIYVLGMVVTPVLGWSLFM
uniref:NADH-ubiquinone oxidoreductase chain 2 n=1 Tax=Tetragnatha cf. tincochacae DDC-2018 TaxID=2067681 RepID=A0A2I6BYM8_9ARAC|nr:NADH dehydrogenase subunit 2 [Tetragnatha cf. tincochacae DDC-2018]